MKKGSVFKYWAFFMLKRNLLLLSLLCYATLVLYNIFANSYVSKALSNPIDVATFLFIPIAIISLYYWDRVVFINHTKEEYLYVYVAIALTTVTLLSISIANITASTTGPYILVGALLATLGWLWSSYNATKNARKAHTLNILLQLRNSSVPEKYGLIGKLFGEEKITNDLISKKSANINKSTDEITSDIRYVTNYLEFICAGMMCGDIDQKLIRETVCSIIIRWYDLNEEYIREQAKKSNETYDDNLYKNLREAASLLRSK